MRSDIKFIGAFIVLWLAQRAVAATCIKGITNDTNISDGTNNPMFVETSTGLTFPKYETPILDAIEAELVAMEYTGRYELDVEGNWWIVSRDGKPLSRMTKVYGEKFAGTPPAPGRVFDYDEYEPSDYINALQRVRGNITLQTEAMQWARSVKAAYWETQSPDDNKLDKRKSYTCARGSFCQDTGDCQLAAGSYCNICAQRSCWYSVIIDGC